MFQRGQADGLGRLVHPEEVAVVQGSAGEGPGEEEQGQQQQEQSYNFV